jgi:dTDP-4-dehydrorhamnose reductase
MLGHKMFQVHSARFPDVWGTMRGSKADPHWRKIGLYATDRVIDNFDASSWADVVACLKDLRPDVTVNCVGVIKQRADSKSAIPSIAINALLPHRIAEMVRDWGGRLIHISSDCVFSGARGNYTEDDPSDAVDLYGRSKFLGEITTGDVLTLRTSIIGRELHHHESLLDWFLGQEGNTVGGYTRAWWSGVTNLHLSELVSALISFYPDLRGLYQVSSGRMSKYELLGMLRDGYGLTIDIEPDGSVVCDRSLDGSRLEAAAGYCAPPWREMINDLVHDQTPYDDWRSSGAKR